MGFLGRKSCLVLVRPTEETSSSGSETYIFQCFQGTVLRSGQKILDTEAVLPHIRVLEHGGVRVKNEGFGLH